MAAKGDFHLHSTASDGVQSPTWVMETAARNGVRVLALTDHDTTAGLAEAGAAAERLGMRLIPGLELSTDHGKADVHLLAYGIDVTSSRLQDYLRELRAGRLGRMSTMVEILAAEGVPIELERVLQIAGEATVGKPHVARALVERGHAQSVQEAFDRWLGNGRVADVQRLKQSPEDSISIVHDCGGLVFVAHAIFIGEDYPDVIRLLAGWGADGIETYYKHYDAATVKVHADLADELHIGKSGGSDYHGLGNPDDREIGDIPFADEQVDAFVAYLEAKGIDTNARHPK